MTFAGLIKGSPLQIAHKQTFPVYDSKPKSVLGCTEDGENLCEGLYSPVSLVWRWVKRVYVIHTPRATIKASPGVSLRLGPFDTRVNTGNYSLATVEEFSDKNVEITELRVLAPMFVLLFEEENVWVTVRGIRVLMPSVENFKKESENEQTRKIEDAI